MIYFRLLGRLACCCREAALKTERAEAEAEAKAEAERFGGELP